MALNRTITGQTQNSGREAALSDIDLAAYDVICVDLFDTLVRRVIHPEDVKKLVCERLTRQIVFGISSDTLYHLRSQVEANLCARNHSEGADAEFRLEEAYDELWRRLPAANGLSREWFTEFAIELELSTECSLQYVDPSVRLFLEKLSALPKVVCLVSDFYVRSHCLRRILEYHDLDKYFRHVFVSADQIRTKRSGKLYMALCSELAVSPERILMIGDNEHADVVMAMKCGLHAFHLSRHQSKGQYPALAATRETRSAISDQVKAALKSIEPAVFPELALSLYCFTENLYDSLIARGIRDVFFVAREGEFLKRLFESYQARRTPTSKLYIRSHYLEASRRATFLPSLGPLESESFDALFRQYRRISARDFLMSLGLEDSLPFVKQLVGTDTSIRIEDFPSSSIYRAIKATPEFQLAYETQRCSRRAAFISYLQSFPLQEKSSTLCLVDVGWKGTTQDNISRIFKQAPEQRINSIEGFYVGLLPGAATDPTSKKHGALFSLIEPYSPWFRVFNENRTLFEVMLMSEHASTCAYSWDGNGRGIPVRSVFPEDAFYRNHVRPAQEKIHFAFHELDALLFGQRHSANSLYELAARNHRRIVFAATDEEIDWFTRINHPENFGLFDDSALRVSESAAHFGKRLAFWFSLLRQRGRADLGFWPWLTCLKRGGKLCALTYRMYRLLR